MNNVKTVRIILNIPSINIPNMINSNSRNEDYDIFKTWLINTSITNIALTADFDEDEK